jgi:hypothetical protein
MKDFKNIEKICQENREISEMVIDEFLLYYAASRNSLDHQMNLQFNSYRHVSKELQQEWVNMLKSQYIVHKIFKKDGLIKSFLKHSAIQKLDLKQREYLELQSEQAWRFSFSTIKARPAENFYLMEDVFSDQEFLLYSPGVTNILEGQSVCLWFNLIAYNGACWQTYGPIGAYSSFEPDDIFFFATEIKPDIEDEKELMENIENNPVPYMMLLVGANFPFTFNKDDQFIIATAEYDLDSLNTKELTKTFKSEYIKGVYRLMLKKWSKMPHFSQAYFDENKKVLLLTSLTDSGFRALVDGFNEYGYNFYTEPFIRVNPTIITTASIILKRKIILNKYDQLFEIEQSPSNKERLDKINNLLKFALPYMNAGDKLNIEELAEKAGLDIETAKDIIKQVLDKDTGIWRKRNLI